jgi:hypothetical protein
MLELEAARSSAVINEVVIYKIGGIIFLAGLPVALIFAVLPARTMMRKRVRSIAMMFIGGGICFVGFVASWPGPNSVTIAMMLGGLLTFITAAFCFARSYFSPKTSN